MAKKKREVPPIKVLNPSPEQMAFYREHLIKHYSALPGFKGDPIAKTSEVLEACKTGWAFCPNTFEERVRTKAKWRHSGGGNLRTWGELTASKASREMAIRAEYDEAMGPPPLQPALEEVIDHIGRDKIIKTLCTADKKFWRQRERYYRREFEFNSSSDFALLIEVISNELKINKIHEMEFEELERKPDPDRGIEGPDPQKLLSFSRMVSEAHKQLQDSLKALGVTRDQRKDELDAADGDIASLSISLDKKIKAQEALEAVYAEEEEAGLRRKFLRGDVYDVGLPRAIHNKIPNAEEIAEIVEESGIMGEEEDGS